MQDISFTILHFSLQEDQARDIHAENVIHRVEKMKIQIVEVLSLVI